MSQTSSLKFGTSGLRGLAEDLVSGASVRYAAAFARHLVAAGHARAGAPVCVGRDLRESSPAIAADVLRGLAASGLAPVDCAAVPTPALAHYAMSEGAACLMVTGSHIPADRNGLKFYRPDGEIDKDDEAAITALAEGRDNDVDAAVAGGSEGGGGDRQPAVLDAYRARYRGFMAADALARKRIGIYQHSSVAADIVAEIVASFGATIVPLGHSPVFVPVDTEAIDGETVTRLAAWAKAERLDAILSTDGDGDRPLVADETGTPIRGDALGLIGAIHLSADTVVTPVTSNSGIADHRGFKVVRTRVGSPYVIAGMAGAKGEGAGGRCTVIGFEANGGLLTATPVMVGETTLAALPTRDAVLPMLCVLAQSARRAMPLSRLVADLALPVAASDRIENYAGERSRALVEMLGAGRQNADAFVAGLGAVVRTDCTDGVQIFFEDGAMIHFRPSGNAPEMRCYAEAADLTRAKALLAGGLARLKEYRPGD